MTSREVPGRFRLAGALAAAAAVAAASLAAPPAQGSATGALFYGVPHSDLLLHFVGYLVLTYLTLNAVRVSVDGEWRGGVEAALLGVVAFGVALEMLQIGVPGRAFSLVDVAADATGAAAGYLLVVRRRGSLRP